MSEILAEQYVKPWRALLNSGLGWNDDAFDSWLSARAASAEKFGDMFYHDPPLYHVAPEFVPPNLKARVRGLDTMQNHFALICFLPNRVSPLLADTLLRSESLSPASSDRDERGKSLSPGLPDTESSFAILSPAISESHFRVGPLYPALPETEFS